MTELTQRDLKGILSHLEYVNKLHFSNQENNVTIDIPEKITLSVGDKTLGVLSISDYSDEYVFTPNYADKLEIKYRNTSHVPIPPSFSGISTYNP